MWPHFLVEQYIDNASSLDKISKLLFHLEVRITHAQRFELPGYTPKLDAAQFTFVLIIKNVNPQSPGYKQFMWYQIPLYDDRAKFPNRCVSQDILQHSNAMIFNAGAAVYTNKTLWSGKWVTFDLDIRPLIVEGMEIAWQRGCLKGSQNLADYRVTECNLGWEVPGINKVAAQIRNLSLKQVVDK